MIVIDTPNKTIFKIDPWIKMFRKSKSLIPDILM